MEYEIPDFLLAAPEIILLTMVCVILVVDLFLPDAHRVWTYALSQLSLIGTAVLVFAMGGEEVAYTFNGMFVDDPMADVLKIAVCLTVTVMLAYSRAYVAARDMYRGEFFVLSLFATLGMMVMISANHFLMLYLGLELLSLSLYAMVALPRDSGKQHRGGDEVLRARRAGLRHAALRHVDDLWRDRVAGGDRSGAAHLSTATPFRPS